MPLSLLFDPVVVNVVMNVVVVNVVVVGVVVMNVVVNVGVVLSVYVCPSVTIKIAMAIANLW